MAIIFPPFVKENEVRTKDGEHGDDLKIGDQMALHTDIGGCEQKYTICRLNYNPVERLAPGTLL